jgi:hypothetical protein
MTDFRVTQKAGIGTSYRLGIPQDVGCAKREAQSAALAVAIEHAAGYGLLALTPGT